MELTASTLKQKVLAGVQPVDLDDVQTATKASNITHRPKFWSNYLGIEPLKASRAQQIDFGVYRQT
jgi:hypothetical protein